MLSDRTIREINDQIQRDLREVRMASDQEEAMAAIERVDALKKLLSPQPTQTDILAELATALKSTPIHETPPQTAAPTLADVFLKFLESRTRK